MSAKKSVLKLLGLENLAQTIKGLVDARVEVFKYELKGELSKSLAKLISGLILLMLALSALLFSSIALGIYIGTLLDNYYLGFLTVSGVYLFLLLSLIVFRKQIGLERTLENKFNLTFGVESEKIDD